MDSNTVATATARDAPGPRIWPIVGNLGVYRGLLPFMEQEWKKHGDVFRIQAGSLGGLVIAHPTHLQRVLVSKRQNYVKGASYDNLRAVVGDGLITLDGERWKERRALAQPSFHRTALVRLTEIMVETGARNFERLGKRLARGGSEVDLHHEMTRLTLDVVVHALFGEKTLKNTSISYETFGDALELVSDSANGVPVPAWIPTPHNLRFRRVMRELDASVYEVIRVARESAEEGTLLSMFIGARDDSGNPLTDRQLRDEVMELFVAGHETTALTMTWLFALLADHPTVLGKMREEVESVLCGRDPTFEDVPRLPYLRQVIDETLRMRSPAALVARNALAADEIGGFRVHPGDAIIPFLWGVHRHPDFWVDPTSFNPERFSEAASKGRHAYSYIPFSAGPRTCIGNHFSIIETVVLTAQMLNRFVILLDSCADVKPVAIGTVRPSRPILARLSTRGRG